jgi:ferredoxin-thioredoxin reductase catalytic subunit
MVMPEPGKEKTSEDTRTFVEMVAKKNGWHLHPDEMFLNIIIDGLTVNYNRYGYFSCPCRDADGVREKDGDIICPCHYCVPDQKEHGHCYCGLYLTGEFSRSGKKPGSIPERRFSGSE